MSPPYLWKCFGLCPMYRNYTCGEKDTTRCREKDSWCMSQLFMDPFYPPFQPLFLAPFPFLSPVHTVALSHEPPSSAPSETSLPTAWHPGPLLLSLQTQVHFFFESKSDRMSACFPASVELEHWFLSGVAFVLFYRNCYLLPWCS